MPPRAQTYKGMKDYLPLEMRRRQFIVNTLTTVATRYGFEPMQTPIVEYEETIAGKLGDDEKLIYRLQYGDDRLALRYDQTVSLARVVAQYPADILLPFRRYAFGPSYRGERPQRGRFREFYQFDLDIVGAPAPIADAEIIALICDSLLALGFTGFRVLLNNRQILTAIAGMAGVDEQAAGGIYRAIDKWDKIGPTGVAEILTATGIPAPAVQRIVDVLQLQGAASDILSALEHVLGANPAGLAAVRELAAVVTSLGDLGVDPAYYAVAPNLARGLSYYTGTVFEAVIEQPPIGSLLGGGRYDNLIGTFAGRSVPTVGTAFGIERLQIVMSELAIAVPATGAPQLFVTIFAPELAPHSLALARRLRDADLNTVTALAPDKLGKQLKEAAARQVPFAIILGPDELSRHEVILRDMATGEQRTVPDSAIVSAILELL
ncbi:MAG: histidine--tRNA ligase [Herpetosiphon sp.]